MCENMNKEIEEIKKRLNLDDGLFLEPTFNEGDTRYYDIVGEKGEEGQVQIKNNGELYHRGVRDKEWKKA